MSSYCAPRPGGVVVLGLVQTPHQGTDVGLFQRVQAYIPAVYRARGWSDAWPLAPGGTALCGGRCMPIGGERCTPGARVAPRPHHHRDTPGARLQEGEGPGTWSVQPATPPTRLGTHQRVTGSAGWAVPETG
jgi:hypothetical protein